jgi:hypothetical protein
MTIAKMREALNTVYSGPTWRLRVMGMEDRQVIAIFKSMVEEGRLNNQGKKIEKPKPKKTKDPLLKEQEDSIQMTIWDYMDGKKG